ncbi:hypothetical protein GQX74_001691 [Glossina fuscipes]|nr:hypothetical protein GQX74_001691 [Glossina fuscipes]
MARLVFAEKGVVRPRRSRMIKNIGWRSVRLLLEPSTRKWWEDPDVVVASAISQIEIVREYENDAKFLNMIQSLLTHEACNSFVVISTLSMLKSDTQSKCETNSNSARTP